jgi:hypothetical protein
VGIGISDVIGVVVIGVVVVVPPGPLLPPHPTANVSTAAPPTIVIVALEIVLDPKGMRPSLPC